jgi:multidrug efflux pump subunit AcrA (membrane-fusion protein)
MKLWRRIAIAFAVLLLAAGGVWSVQKLRASRTVASLPTAPVRKGEFLVIVRCRGELRSRRSVQITAPVNVPELRILWMAPVNSAVKQGDVVIRFDPSSARQQLNERKAALQQAEAALDQAVAQARVTAEQDKLDLGSARYAVERAKLEVSKAEIVSRLQAEESKVDLSITETKLNVQRATLDLNDTSSRSRIASLTRARDKAKDEVALTEDRLSRMEVRAPGNGVILYLPNYSQGWVNAKPFKVGDQVWPGGAIAEIPDLETLEMEGKVEEIDRGRVALGQDVLVRLDAFPEAVYRSKLEQLSPMTVMSWEWPPTRTFRGTAKIGQADTRLRPSMNGRMDVVVNRIPEATSVPAQALFSRGGKALVYSAQPDGYRTIEVEVLARNPDEVAVRGVPADAKVALVEPGKEDRR